MRKRILSLIMVLVMIFGMMPVSVLAADTGLVVMLDGTRMPVRQLETTCDASGYGGSAELPWYEVTVPVGTEMMTPLEMTWNGQAVPNLFSLNNSYPCEVTYFPMEYGEFLACTTDVETYALDLYCCISFVEGEICYHSYSDSVTTAATCTADGVRTFTCAACGDSYTEAIAATGHSYADGKCTACGEEDPAAHKHSYTGSVTTEATCTAVGVKTFRCACGHSYTESIAATGHSYTDGICTVCGEAESAAHEHSYTESVTTAATCTVNGVKTFACACGYSYTESIVAAGHTAGDDATCTKAQTCTVCGEELAPATGHSYVDGVCSCGAMQNVVVYAGSDWPVNYYYIASLKLSGLQVDYVSGTDIYVNHTTPADAEFTMTATAGGSSSGNLGVNWNDDSTNTLTYSGSLTDGGATVKVYAYKAQGSGISRNGTKTFTIHTAEPNEAPTLAAGVGATATATTTANTPYTLDLGSIFTDADGDALTYTVAINGAAATATAAAYSYPADVPGTHTLVFTATDGKSSVCPTYTVTLTVKNSEITYDVPVTLPEGVNVTFKAVNSVSGSTLTLGDTLMVEENTVKVPENISRIAWECDGYVCGSAATASGTELELVTVSFAVTAGDAADNAATVTITGADGLSVSGGTADSYLIAAGEGYTYAVTAGASGYNGVTLSGQTAVSGEVPVALVLKHFTVIAPAGSVVSAGTLSGSFNYSFAAPLSQKTEGDTVTYTFAPLSGAAFIRVQRPDDPDAVTYWDYKSSKADGKTITVTPEMLFMGDSSFNAATVYRNFEQYSFDLGDIYLNINNQGYVNLNVGETKQLNAHRNWQAINSFTNDKIALPDFEYEVIDIEGSNVVSITPDANNSGYAAMTANSTGTAIVLVTYNAMYSELNATGSLGGEGGAKRLSASWPDRTGVFVVSVGKDGSAIQSNMTCNGAVFDAEHSPQFYTGTAGASVSFTPEADVDVTVSRGTPGAEKLSFGAFTRTGVEVDSETGEVTVSGLTTGRHIIRLEKGGVASYQVVTATQTTAVYKDAEGNLLDENRTVKPGDTVSVTITGLTNPAEKFATKYNFNCQITYKDQKGNAYSNSSGATYGKYDFSSIPQTVSITVPADWDEETLTLNGFMKMGGFAGDGIGSHRKVSYGVSSGMAWGSDAGMELGTLPELTLNIAKYDVTLPATEGVTVTATEDSTSPVLHGGSYSFTVDVAEGYNADAMKVMAGETELTADENGVYTVESVTEAIAITVEGVVKEATSPVYPFTSVTADGETVADADIESKGTFALDGSGSDTYGGTYYETPWYHITVPAGTENVEMTYPSDANIFYFQHTDGSPAFAGYDAGIDADAIDAMTSATVKNRTLYNHGSVNSDGSYTVRLEAERYALTDNVGTGFALEKEDFSPITMVTFGFAPCPGHEYDSVVTEPTCTEDGYTTYTCSICGDSYTGDATKAPGHSYDAGTCTVCGEADPDYVAPAPGVTIPEGAPFTAVEGAISISDEGTVDFTAYNTYSGVPLYHVTVPAGTTEVQVTYSADRNVFLGTGDYAGQVYGYYAETSGWTGGGATLSGTDNGDGTITVTIPMSQSFEDWNVGTVDADFTNGYAIGPEDVNYAPINFFTFEYGAAAPGSCEHSYTESVTTEPTCGAAGVKTFSCSKCGESYTESIAATGKHSYTEEVTTAPTCGKTGVKTFTCAKCGDSYTETVAATGEHTETAVVTAPTCTKYGYTTYTCSVCGASRTADSVEPTGEHNYVDGFCSDCGAADPNAGPTLTDGVYQIGTADELIWFATAVNNGETAIQGALTADIDLSGKDWPGIGTSSKPFAGSFDGKDKTVDLGSAGVGLFGRVKGSSNTARAEIKNVITEGTVSAAAAVGGIAGFAQNANFTACINRADVSNSNKYAAGITCGLDSISESANLTISRCGNEGTISAGTAAAGIVTITKGGVAVSNCYNSGSISGSGASTVTGGFGGIVGYAQGYKGAVTVSGCYNSGKISGNDNVAGIVGCLYNGNTVSNCFSIGEAAYAIAGRTYNNSNTVTNCYFLASASTAAAPAKTNNNLETNVSATALTGKEMSTADFVTQLSDANFQRSCPAPVFTWQSAAEHKLVDGACTECGYGALATYEVSIPESEMYTVTGETTVTEGGSYSFTVTIHEDYQTNSSFAVRVNGTVVSETDGVYTVTDVKGPLVITVEGVEKCPDSFTVSLPAKGNGYHVDAAEGSASPVEKGGSYSFTVTFPTGFRAGSDFKVLANGSTLTAVDGVYTIENVTADQTVTVTGVELIPYADTTSVTITVSSETMDFYRAPGSGDLLLLKDLEVPYFDLSLYGLQKYYYHPNSYDFTPYQAGNTELAYGVVTGMHALIYATEVFYLGYDAEDAGQGESYRTDTDGDGTSDFEEAISWTGGPGSSFMDLWGRGTNLNYYADYTYPMSSIDGIGATSDQIAIYDGYKIDVHYIENSAASGSDYGFLAVNDANGSFDGVNTDTVDYATVKQGDALTLTMFTAGEGSNYETTYWTTEGRKVYWTETSNVTDSITGWKRTDFGGLNADTLVTGANGLLTLDTTKIEPGTYYIAAEGGFREGGQVDNAGFVSRGKQAGPAVLCLTVLEGYIQPEPEVVLGDYDGDGELKMTDIAKTYKAFQEETELTDAQLAALDVNGNGKLDMSDFAKIYAAFKVQ